MISIWQLRRLRVSGYLAGIFATVLESSAHAGIDNDELLAGVDKPLLTFFVFHDGYVDLLQRLCPFST